jgi:uncharacterized protein YjiS (DUF1127 family)
MTPFGTYEPFLSSLRLTLPRRGMTWQRRGQEDRCNRRDIRMTLLTESHHAPLTTGGAQGLLHRWRAWRRSHRTESDLRALTDHQLRDIGIHRDRIGLALHRR